MHTTTTSALNLHHLNSTSMIGKPYFNGASSFEKFTLYPVVSVPQTVQWLAVTCNRSWRRWRWHLAV